MKYRRRRRSGIETVEAFLPSEQLPQRPPLRAEWRCRFRVQGAGCRVQGAGCGVQVAGCMVQVAGFRVQGAGCRVQGKC